MKEKFHRIRYLLNNLAYHTFDENNKDQRAALQEMLIEVDLMIKNLDREYENEA
jgi:hypothetical protein